MFGLVKNKKGKKNYTADREQISVVVIDVEFLEYGSISLYHTKKIICSSPSPSNDKNLEFVTENGFYFFPLQQYSHKVFHLYI